MLRRPGFLLPILLLAGLLALPAARAFPGALAGSRPILLPPGSTLLGMEAQALAALFRGASGRPLVALTFDDGPYPLYTPALLDVLRRRGARATFFLTGSGARDFPELARQIAGEGHEIGNHTWSHRRESELSATELENEVLAAEAEILRATGRRTRLFRPAGGGLSTRVLEVTGRLGYTTVLETVNPGDWWIREPDRLYRGMLRGRLRDGVLLLHSGSVGTLRALPTVLDELQRKGFRFVTVSELAR